MYYISSWVNTHECSSAICHIVSPAMKILCRFENSKKIGYFCFSEHVWVILCRQDKLVCLVVQMWSVSRQLSLDMLLKCENYLTVNH